MSITETHFRKSVSNLKPPSSGQYIQADWDLAYGKISPTDDDTRLYEAAKWIASEYAELSKKYPSPAFGSLDSEWATILAVAILNRDHRIAEKLRDEVAKERRDDPIYSMDAFSGLRIEGNNGQHFTTTDFAESSTDLTENWLFDALKVSGSSAPPEDLTTFGVAAGKFYSFRKLLSTLWNQAWFDAWYFDLDKDGATIWMPSDPDAMILDQSWLQRQQTNLMNYPYIDISIWPSLSPSQRRKRSRLRAVTSVRRTENSVLARVSSAQYLSSRPPVYTIERSGLEGSFIADFLDVDMPNAKGVTVAHLLSAWHLILDIAHGLSRVTKLPQTISPKDAREIALTVPEGTLVQAIAEGIPIDAVTAKKIVEFLTFEIKTSKNQKGNRGLWSAPLVKIPNCNDYLLPLPALETSNPLRKAEAWMEKGGIDDSNPIAARGEKYEVIYRARIRQAVIDNRYFKTASVAEHGVKKTKDFGEQIDLLVAFGGICLVGEVKLLLMPADPFEKARYDGKLKSAATQAKRKTQLLQTRPDVAAKALGIAVESAKSLRYIPIVIPAQDYGFSTKVDDVLIVEASFLKLYLSGGDLVVGRAIQKGSSRAIDRTIQYYQTEAQAGQNVDLH
ncbi:hypothetical protein CYG48_08905 [Neorhizobium sp. SOG26]|uniref:hypothetical protein n=1 Tax=Neorhizobium sp. SOG26 TaxID=2060726 RepID=UPI000E587AA0|nr:hypothetical protein [Neorhizobium sp. SOG26]AXV15803.1 hypothetical protein CYG48_08905 [Neorhizobium sp. SOG26]